LSRKTALSASARDFAALVLKMSTVAMKVYTWATVDSSILNVIFYHTFVSSSTYSCSRAFQHFSKPVPAFKKALFLRCTFHHTNLFLLLKHSAVALETLFKSCSSPPLVHIMLS
jgi:hypothetical protein